MPINYKVNQKSRMTFILRKNFKSETMICWKKKSKIILLVENYTAHPHLENIKCIKLVFRLSNKTSVLQLMDQGVISSLKSRYKKTVSETCFRKLWSEQHRIQHFSFGNNHFVRKVMETDEINDDPQLLLAPRSFKTCVVGKKIWQRGGRKGWRKLINSSVV